MTITHTLKCLPVYFDAVKRGEKNFEVRRDDRGFQKGDQIILQRLCEQHNKHAVEMNYDGKVAHEIQREIIYVLTGGQLGIEPGYVVLGLQE